MSARADRVEERLAEHGIDALLVTAVINVRYLTGYTGSNGIAVIAPGVREFVTDFRYVEQAADEVDPSFERRRAPQDLLEAVEDLLAPGDVRLGFEEAHVSVRQHRRLRELLPERVSLVGVFGLVEGLRAVKEPAEVELIREAARLADEAFKKVVGEGLIGRSERSVALALENEMRALGSRGPSFDSIVATGRHGALPHYRPQDVPIAAGDLVVIDWGAELDGYCSDCTRTVAAGEPGDHARAIYDLVLQAQLAGVRAVRASASGYEVDSVARNVIEAGGHGPHFGHGLGHGVGLDIHEGPRLSQRSEDELAAGNVVTVEPGVYLPGEFGVRIEDLVVVTDDGCEILSGLGKELILSP